MCSAQSSFRAHPCFRATAQRFLANVAPTNHLLREEYVEVVWDGVGARVGDASGDDDEEGVRRVAVCGVCVTDFGVCTIRT